MYWESYHMGHGLFLLMSLQLFLPFRILLASHPPPQLWCHDDERSALWEFKGSLALKDPNYDTCFGSWQLEGEARNCCSWQGVECGGPYNHVIGLHLSQCGGDPYGSIDSNSSIFRLVHLQKLNLYNLDLSYSSIPTSIGNLRSLRELHLYRCNLQGLVPPSVSNLTQLVTLDLTLNNFQGPILPFISNLTNLVTLDLGYNQFTGDIPPSLSNLVQLGDLDLRSNQFTGEIPSQLASLTRLNRLGLSFNKLHGTIPVSFSELRNLTNLFLRSNNLSGTLQLDMFSEMTHLEELILSFNNFSLAIGLNTSDSLKNLQILGLAQCKLNEFPKFLEKLETLFQLDLSYNNLSGQIPEWFLNTGLQTLAYLNLSHNSLTGFQRDLSYYNATNLKSLDLRFNKLQGSLPIPASLVGYYLVSNNMLSGELSPLLCDLRYVSLLDLSKNNFTGELPQCLSNLSENLVMLALHSNNFHGRIPPFGSNTGTCALQMIDLSNNQLQGPLPRSLSNCSEFTFLNLGSNMISDTFPSWLGSLSNLRVLILRSNKFHGGIEEPESAPGFPRLQIIDLSHNNFQLSLPAFYFRNWKYMAVSGPEQGYYLSVYIGPFGVFQGFEYPSYDFSMTIVNKGVQMEYEKIIGYFKVVDFSSNNFTGEIPDSIASLDGLHLLNLSNNLLFGPVPTSLGALAALEALDFSQNELSGEIPQQLTQLNFLAVFNVSYNNLSGSIPRGKQFDSFQNNSYWGNEGLCGDPLLRKCGSAGLPPPAPPRSAGDHQGSDVIFRIEWKAVAAGYAGSFIIAAVIGNKIIMAKPEWFARAYGLRQRRRA